MVTKIILCFWIADCDWYVRLEAGCGLIKQDWHGESRNQDTGFLISIYTSPVEPWPSTAKFGKPAKYYAMKMKMAAAAAAAAAAFSTQLNIWNYSILYISGFVSRSKWPILSIMDQCDDILLLQSVAIVPGTPTDVNTKGNHQPHDSPHLFIPFQNKIQVIVQ